MKTVLLIIIAIILAFGQANAAPKKETKPKAGSPQSPAVVAPNVLPTPADPASVFMLRPDQPGVLPLGPGTIATTPSFNIAADQLLPPLTNWFYQPTASDNQLVISATPGSVYKIKVTVNATLTGANYLRLYNGGTGFAGCGSATNLIYEAVINPTSGLSDDWNSGMAGFNGGITVCITGGYGTTDTSSATAAAMNVNIGWH